MVLNPLQMGQLFDFSLSDFVSNVEDSVADAELSNPSNLLEDVQLFNSQEAAMNREWASAENELNRQFQMEMSNTAYQRAAEDMKKAGLNPALLLSSGFNSASTGVGSSIGGTNATSAAPSNSNTLSSLLSSVAGVVSSAAGLLKVVS